VGREREGERAIENKTAGDDESKRARARERGERERETEKESERASESSRTKREQASASKGGRNPEVTSLLVTGSTGPRAGGGNRGRIGLGPRKSVLESCTGCSAHCPACTRTLARKDGEK